MGRPAAAKGRNDLVDESVCFDIGYSCEVVSSGNRTARRPGNDRVFSATCVGRSPFPPRRRRPGGPRSPVIKTYPRNNSRPRKQDKSGVPDPRSGSGRAVREGYDGARGADR